MKVTITGFVHARARRDYEMSDAPTEYSFFTFDATDSSMGYMKIGPASFEYELPAEWNPVAAEVASLEAKKAKALADYQQTVSEINDRLSKLQAITCEVPA